MLLINAIYLMENGNKNLIKNQQEKNIFIILKKNIK